MTNFQSGGEVESNKCACWLCCVLSSLCLSLSASNFADQRISKKYLQNLIVINIITCLHCMYRASYCNVYMNQQDAQLLTNNLYSSLFCCTCFGRTIRPSSGAPSSKLYHAFGTFVQASLTATWLFLQACLTATWVFL